MLKVPNHTKRLLQRLGIYLLLFIFISGLLGTWIIGSKLLYGFYFFIYPNIGKLGIFSIILFGLLAKDTLLTLHVSSFKRYQYAFLGLSVLCVNLFFFVIQSLLQEQSFFSNIVLSLAAHLIFISIPVTLFIGVFGLNFIKQFTNRYKKQLLICLLLSTVLYAAIFQVWKLWPYLSMLVLQAQYLIFSQLFEPVYIIEPYGLFVKSFAVEIAEACSGLESIFLFTVLYIAIVIIDIKKLSLKKVVILFPFLMLALVVVNILRVFLLILIGVLINPQIMAALFHTYLGLILFVIFFFLFMKFGYPFVKKK